MLFRLRQALWIVVAVGVGFILGNGPFSQWVLDTWRMLQVTWLIERTLRASGGGAFPLLLAGFLLGQGIYLLSRRLIAEFGVAQVRRSERIAAWDPSLQLATRFGLHRYLEQCTTWAAEDPTARTQCLALFKIEGLGLLNEQQSTFVATRLLQQIAAEVRQSALPLPVSAVRRWFAHHMPKPIAVKANGVPAPRYAARWSGATFAVAFRELDAVQAVGTARDLAVWIRHELDALEGAPTLNLRAGIALGIPSATARGLARAAVFSLDTSQSGPEGTLLTVVHDPADVRTNAISQMSGIANRESAIDRRNPNAETALVTDNVREQLAAWTKKWGSALGCIIGAFLALQFTGPTTPVQITSYPWPDSLQEVQEVDEKGPHSVTIERLPLESQSFLGWTLSDAMLLQGRPQTGRFYAIQARVRITNGTPLTRFISALNLSALDGNGNRFEFLPQQMVRLANGMTGRWLKPGESILCWLRTTRGDDPVTSLVFEPNPQVRMVLNAQKR